MLFSDARSSLIAVLRARVRNGQLTERGLARLVGVSQPHIHNVLKGVRALSPELSDRILQRLRISLLDLIERDRIQAHLDFASQIHGYAYVPVLAGSLGPDCAWPTEMSATERLPFPMSQVANIPSPVAVRLGADNHMANVFRAGDLALLDQSDRARTVLEPMAYYAVKSGNMGVVRQVQRTEDALYLISGDSQHYPAGWLQIALEGRQANHYIRARVYLATSLPEWSTS